ncbi:MAG: restriction endonuclease subunit S [Pseudomonadota bacterium]
MNTERLLAHYEKIADAPDAIPRLRRFVLDLAVRGKLVPQDPNDEPASELLKRIAAEKARLVKAAEIRPSKDIPPLEEVPFPLPSSWRWSQMAEIGLLSPRNEAPADQLASFIPMPLIPAEYGSAHGQEVRPWGTLKKGYTHFADGDVGLAKITPCFENGKSTIFRNLVGGIGAGTTELHIVRPIFVDANYLLIFLKSPHFIETGIPRMTGTAGQKRVPFEYFAYSPLPLPPLAEQRRIVAKVDELMALIDRLEAARQTREAARDKLTAASLARLNAPDPDTFSDDARFALDALPALTARADQIKHLRQTILNLAVRGKLVPQDPNDEPASELLETIASFKEQNANGRARRRSEHIQLLEGENAPFDLPSGWVWVAFGNIVLSRDGERIPVSKEERNRRAKIYDYYGASGVIDKIDNYLFDKPLLLIGEDGANLINRSTPIAFIARGKYWVNNHAHVLDGPSEEFLRYLELFINAIDLKAYVTGTAQPKMNQAKMNSIPVALPPLAEQRRIVAKVDELMALCDRLEAILVTADESRRRLLEALLAEALAPDAERELEAAE